MTHQSETIDHCFGFNIKWKINKAAFTNQDTVSTTIKEVNGMPGVRWSVKCRKYEEDDRHHTMYATFLITVFTIDTVKCQVNFEGHEKKYKSSTSFYCEEETISTIYRIEYADLFQSSVLFSKNSFTVNIHGLFRYACKPSPIMMNPDDWKFRLIQKLPQDFEIIVGKESIKIIKLFITAESEVFERMFEANFNEAKENKATIKGYKFDTVKNAIDYCYGQDISDFISNRENAIEILLFSNQYNFSTLKPKMEKHFAEILSNDNIQLFASVSEEANALLLRQSCVNFVQSLLNTNPTWPNGEIPEFDPQFMKDVFSQAITKKF